MEETMNLTEIIAARREELTESDRRLVEVLLANRTAGSFLPTECWGSGSGKFPGPGDVLSSAEPGENRNQGAGPRDRGMTPWPFS